MDHYYIGTKKLLAWPKTRGQYNEYRGWETPATENADDAGYMVEYMDGSGGNHPGHKGYISWSPKEVFDKAYRSVTAMTFGLAIEALKKGCKVARGGWNGKGMWLMLMAGGDTTLPTGEEFPALPFIVMKTATGEIVPWLASQSDVLAEDWALVMDQS